MSTCQDLFISCDETYFHVIMWHCSFLYCVEMKLVSVAQWMTQKNCSLTTMSRKLLLYTLDRNSPNAGRFLHSKLSSKFVAESLKIQTHLRGSDACQHYLVKYYLTPFRLAVASDMNLLRHPVFICRNHVNRCILPSLNALFERRH